MLGTWAASSCQAPSEHPCSSGCLREPLCSIGSLVNPRHQGYHGDCAKLLCLLIQCNTWSVTQQEVAAPVDVVPVQRCQEAKPLTVFVNKVYVLIAYF